jgi:hypothetical protein
MRYVSGSLSLLLAKLGTKRNWAHFMTVAGGFALLAASAFFFISCGGSSGSNVAPPPVPAIQSVNDSTDPSSPIGLPIEINGSGFQSAPGQVIFTQSSSGITATVTPNAGGWSDTGIAVTVPTGNGTNNFTVPGTVTVAVKTSGGTSNSVTLTLIQTLTFNVNNVTWTTTAALPTAMTGLRAAAIPVNDTSAYVVTTGGYDGTGNTSDVLVGPLDPTGQISGWMASPNVLPETIAHHAMVEANSGNSLVATGTAFIYVIGGQVLSTDAPGGTTDVYNASFDPATGAVGTWSKLSSSLPESLVGPAATLFNGYVYVVGGLLQNGSPSTDVFSAPVKSDGTLGTWTKSTNAYPTAVSFATAFGFAGKLYVIDGDGASSTDPNAQGGATGIPNVNFATAVNGAVGTWTATSQTIKNRKKQITWTAFGQVIDAEGIYNGLPGSTELERSQVNADSTLASWNGITAVNAPGANVYNAAAVVSPLQSPTATPRFILIGGESYLTPGLITGTVYYNNAP